MSSPSSSSSSSSSSSAAPPPPPQGYPAPYSLSPSSSPQHFTLSFAYPRVLVVCLRRGKLNPWNDEMTHEMTTIFQHISTDPEVDVVVLSGQGRAFCAGLDVTDSTLMSMIEEDPARSAFQLKRHVDDFQASLTWIEKCGKPVIGALYGISFGLAVDIASCCDVRFADEETRFCIKEVDIGLAADIGSLQRFPKIVGNDSWARELALTAREFGAEEAERRGFLSGVTKGGREGVIAAALTTALLIASKSPVAIRSTKAILLHSRDHTVAQGLDYVAVWNAAMLQSRDIPLAMQSALKKQKVAFAKL